MVSAVAEAFPESDELPKPINDELPVQNEVTPLNNSPSNNDPNDTDLVPSVKPTSDEVKPPVSADAPVIVPQQKKKKKISSIPDNDSSIENDENDNDDNDDDDDDEDDFVDKKKPGCKQNSRPFNTLFPMNFGRTSGGAIAIANSFSTGKGGTASSHAIAYGSAAKQKSKKRRD